MFKYGNSGWMAMLFLRSKNEFLELFALRLLVVVKVSI